MADPLCVLHASADEAAATAAAEALEGAADGIAAAGVTTAAALERVRDGTADCLVVHDEPPALDGVSFVKRVRDVDEDVPLVLATDGGDEERITAALAEGATDWIARDALRASPAMVAHRVKAVVERASASESGVRPERIEGAEGDGRADLAGYERILQGVGDSLYATDAAGEFTYVNPAGARLTGYDIEELLESGPSLVYDEDGIQAFEDAIVGLLESDGEEVARVVADIQAKGGDSVPIEATLTIRRDADGEFAGTIGVARDMTERLERERELREYETIVRALPDEVAILDTDGYMTRLIPPAGDETGTSGYRPAELEGEHVSEVMTDEDLETGAAYIAELVAGDRERAAFEMQVVGKDGETHWREDHMALIRGPDGDVQGTVSVLRDIDDRKERERELERYASIIEASGDAVYALDVEGRFTFSNDAHQAIVDRPESELIGSHASIALPDEAVEDGQRLIRELLESDRHHGTYEMDVLQPDGTRIPTENHVALLTDEDGAFRGTVGVLRDISDRKAREKELERQNERLERFAEIASHDLRNPLNVAQGYLEMVRTETDSEHAERVANALDRMERLIDDTLTMARQGTTVESPTTVDLGALVPECWDAVRNDDAALELVEDVSVRADESRLQQLLENLLRNAIEHGGEDVRVRIGALDDEGFFVEDDGPGIPPEDREVVFEAGHTTAADGTGFGLAIVAEIAEAHGWDLRVSESDDGGARFEFRNVDVP